MFQQITMIGFSFVVVVIFLHAVFSRLLGGKAGKQMSKPSNHKQNRVAMLSKAVSVLWLFSFCVLLVTGFGPLLLSCRLHGYMVMAHATSSPVFIGCAAIIVILDAGRYRFNKQGAGVGVKAGFWLLAGLSLPVTLTIGLCMLPLFGTQGQAFLLEAHRWCALIFALVAIVELYMLMRMGVLKDTKK